MGKRTVFSDANEVDISSKRRKVSNGTVTKKHDTREIQSVDQLRSLLAFQQDAGTNPRQNISTFKVFLEVVAYGDDDKDRLRKQNLLLDFLKSELPSSEDTASNYLKDLFQTWSFAAQSSNDRLLSALPAVLALLLKTISNLIDFRECGVRLCETLLRKDQIKLIDRGLTANKTKEFVISPCLRLLTEVVSFDGGSLARRLYLQRDITFKRLDIFLGMRNQSTETNAESRRRHSVRHTALRYFLANLRLQDQAAKGDILAQTKLIRAVFHDIKHDSPDIILDILGTIKKSVVLDVKLSRTAKSRLLTDWVLTRIAGLSNYDQDNPLPEGCMPVNESAYAFLRFVCTTIDHGVLVKQNGWYPPGIETTNNDLDGRDSLLRLGQYVIHDEYLDRVPVLNTTLATFLPGLRPYASVLQKELILAIFIAAPELIADYFFKTKSFSFEPKLSATWIGYCAFLHSIVQLQLPEMQFGEDPPPISVVVEGILPQPLTRKVLARCLNQNTNLITFLATRLLIAAFQKLEGVLASFHNQNRMSPDWKQAGSQLKAEFCKRCPELKHVIAAFRRCPKESIMLKEALTRLVAMYYKLVPQVALEEKFDISIILSATLNDINSEMQDLNHQRVRLLELDQLMEIAHRSPDMQWWQKPDNMSLSPFTAILRLQADTSRGAEDQKIRRLIQSVVREHAILQQETEISALDALKTSLMSIEEWKASDTLYSFLDNCILRLVRRAMKYYGDIADLVASIIPNSTPLQRRPVSLLTIVVLEQWSYFVGCGQVSDLRNVTAWVTRYLETLHYIGEEDAVLLHVRDRLRDQIQEKSCRSMLEEALVRPSKVVVLEHLKQQLHDKENMANAIDTSKVLDIANDTPSLVDLPFQPSQEARDHPGLTRWLKKDMSDAIEDGAVGELLACLCSKHEEIRRQAILGVDNLMEKLKASEYKEWQQIYVLLGEVIESVREVIPVEPCPHFVGAIASSALLVLVDPLHFMYTKINKFLNKSPRWDIAKLPSYWINKTFLCPPTDDDAHYREIEWVLAALMDGLQTPADMDQYRHCNVFERLLSLSSSPTIPRACNEMIVKLLYRCTYVDGSTTLLTRCAVLSWASARIAKDDMDTGMLNALVSRITRTCESDRIYEWSSGMISVTLKPKENTS